MPHSIIQFEQSFEPVVEWFDGLAAADRSEALKRFLLEDGVGRDGRFWRLAQSLSALYPGAGDEKGWVEGVLARKKGIRILIGA